MLETRQRLALWLSFSLGCAVAALVQLPDREPRDAGRQVPVGVAGQLLETTAEARAVPLGTSIAAAATRHGLAPASNLEAGCRYLAALLATFGGDVELALAAYNAGPGAVRRWGGVPPYRETITFVRRVGESYRRITGLDVGTATRYTTDVSAVL